ncbi:MAG: Helix-turn-helix domain [Acidimicrobiales bacterium]|nr:Helix-turn-helix domain [Acidimicrobiales bacterium]
MPRVSNPTVTGRQSVTRPRAALGPDSIGEAIRVLRHRARLTRDALATLTGASAGAISNYENDVSAASAGTLRRLAVVLGEALATDPTELWDQFGAVLDTQGRASER